MTTVWLCATREKGSRPTDHATEADALATADQHARAGRVAVVWPIETEDNQGDQ